MLDHSLPLVQWGANSEYYLTDFHFHSPPLHNGEMFDDAELEVGLRRPRPKPPFWINRDRRATASSPSFS